MHRESKAQRSRSLRGRCLAFCIRLLVGPRKQVTATFDAFSLTLRPPKCFTKLYSKKSNKVQNPNTQKVNHYVNTPDLMGLILVINAEKVILDRLEIKNQLEVIEKTDDEKDKSANELRNLIGKIPNLSIHVDEVHHAAGDDIKLRQVVAQWNRNGTVTSVLGYSGTPYLPTPECINVGGGLQIRFSQITNTVYYYRLVTVIQRFLNKPEIKIGGGKQQPLQILDEGIKMFYKIQSRAKPLRLKIRNIAGDKSVIVL